MKTSIFVGVAVLVLIAASVGGYLWYLSENSPSIIGGGYDRKMEKELKAQEEQSVAVPPSEPVSPAAPAPAAPTAAAPSKAYLPAAWTPSTAGSVSYEMGTFSPAFQFSQIAAADLNASSPVTALGTYNKLLLEGKLEDAAKLSDDPQTTLATMRAHEERIGKEAMRAQLAAGFDGTGTISIPAVAKVGDTYIVLVDAGSYVGSNILVPSGGGYLVNSNPFSLPKDVQAVVDAISEKYNP